eukprot:TRINITY_DN9446_c0_g2_i10.p1 TRINITY_DN9446_c0_g2~~TRINITY_DN9446_c0_g2_i10.p1  ORF type:complete len:522 (+),score=72.27 TRINITY_DN9446_c0_g2_i10:42-1607(+)
MPVLCLLAATLASIRPNVLHLVADDMRPQLGCYGDKIVKSPNLDKLASEGSIFTHAYTQFTVCAPSRNSFMTGRRPDRTQCVNFLKKFRETPGAESWVTMPQFFKNQGYFTSSAGKVYHDGQDDPASWSYPSNQCHWTRCQEGDYYPPKEFSQVAFCGITPNSTTTLSDEDVILSAGISRIQQAVSSNKPWWVSIGVHRPHVPYRLPEGFYGEQLYPNATVAPPAFPEVPNFVPFMSGNWENADQSDDIEDSAHYCAHCVVPKERSVVYRSWYYAAVTYSDHMLGKALAELDRLNVSNNTIVMFHSDHGYHLGELNDWAKKTNSEMSSRIPFIIRLPPSLGYKQNKVISTPVDLVSVYKTVVDLAGFDVSKLQPSVQGNSLKELIIGSNSDSQVGSSFAYSQIPRCGCQMYGSADQTVQCALNACVRTPTTSSSFHLMGYSIRSTQYRYVAWLPWDSNTSTIRKDAWQYPAGRELYNATADSGLIGFDFPGYSFNVAEDPSYQGIVQQLHQQLQLEVTSWP